MKQGHYWIEISGIVTVAFFNGENWYTIGWPGAVSDEMFEVLEPCQHTSSIVPAVTWKRSIAR